MPWKKATTTHFRRILLRAWFTRCMGRYRTNSDSTDGARTGNVSSPFACSQGCSLVIARCEIWEAKLVDTRSDSDQTGGRDYPSRQLVILLPRHHVGATSTLVTDVGYLVPMPENLRKNAGSLALHRTNNSAPNLTLRYASALKRKHFLRYFDEENIWSLTCCLEWA